MNALEALKHFVRFKQYISIVIITMFMVYILIFSKFCVERRDCAILGFIYEFACDDTMSCRTKCLSISVTEWIV